MLHLLYDPKQRENQDNYIESKDITKNCALENKIFLVYL